MGAHHSTTLFMFKMSDMTSGKKANSEIRDLQRVPRALCDPGRSFVNRLQSRSHCGVRGTAVMGSRGLSLGSSLSQWQETGAQTPDGCSHLPD